MSGPSGPLCGPTCGFGTVFWRPAPTEVPAAAPVFLVAGRLTVRIQVQALDAEQSRWPLEHTLAWADRHAPRDLADLAELPRTGSFDVDAARLVHDMSGV